MIMPESRRVDELGLVDPNYSRGSGVSSSPRSAYRRRASMRSRDWITNAAFVLAMETLGRRACKRLLHQANDPASTQLATLKTILRLCQSTEQGKQFGLGADAGIDEFRRVVPIRDYEDIRWAMKRQIETAAPEIAPEKPIMYARSSGTTGAPKYIPVTRHVLSQLRRAQRAMAFAQHDALNAFSGKLVGLAGTCREEIFADGTPAGATSGLIYESMPRFMRTKYVVPPAVFGIDDYDLKYRVIARLAVQTADVTVIATANPSTILRLIAVVRRDLPRLVEEIRSGEARALARVDPTLAAQIEPSMEARSVRAAALRALLPRQDALTIADVWPDLRAIFTWLGGGCALAADEVRRQLPPGATMVDAGYVASEMRGTIVVDIARGLALPLLEDVFFEFIPAESWDAGDRETLLLQELEEGRNYHVIVTTAAGLLRYHMNDVVRATPRIGQTPTLAFVRKGRGVTNITGEKLSEDQVHSAMAYIAKTSGMTPVFYVVLSDPQIPGYRAFVEYGNAHTDVPVIAARFDERLCELNIEYAAKRKSGRLQSVSVTRLRPGTGDSYHRHCVETKKQREAQAKVLALQNANECDFDFTSFEVADALVASEVR